MNESGIGMVEELRVELVDERREKTALEHLKAVLTCNGEVEACMECGLGQNEEWKAAKDFVAKHG